MNGPSHLLGGGCYASSYWLPLKDRKSEPQVGGAVNYVLISIMILSFNY